MVDVDNLTKHGPAAEYLFDVQFGIKPELFSTPNKEIDEIIGELYAIAVRYQEMGEGMDIEVNQRPGSRNYVKLTARDDTHLDGGIIAAIDQVLEAHKAVARGLTTGVVRKTR